MWQAFDDLPFSNIKRVKFEPSDDGLNYVRQRLARPGHAAP